MSNIVLQTQKSNAGSILNNDNVLFNEVLLQEGNIDYDLATGIITIQEQGTYLLDWFVVTQSATSGVNVMFKLTSNLGHEFFSNMPTKIGGMTGLAILQVTGNEVPLSLQLLNVSNGTVDLASTVPAKTNLRVYQLDNLIADNGRCFALDQFANVLEQWYALYPDSTVTIFANRLPTTSGQFQGLYKAADAGNVPMMIVGDPDTLINISTITALYFPDSAYVDTITYLQPPVPFPKNCDTDLIKNIYEYVSVGDNITITGGVNTSASGAVTKNEYGIIVMADEASTIFLYTPNLFSISINDTEGLMAKSASTLTISG